MNTLDSDEIFRNFKPIRPFFFLIGKRKETFICTVDPGKYMEFV